MSNQRRRQAAGAHGPTRRKFLTRALAGCIAGVAASAPAAQSQATATTMSGVCDVPCAASDSLTMYDNLLLSVQMKVYEELMAEQNAAVRRSSNLLATLQKLVGELSEELKKNPAKPAAEHVQQLNRLVALGRVVEVAAMAGTPGVPVPSLAASLGIVAQGAEETAANLLPQGPATLSKEALRIINSILAAIRSSGGLQRELTQVEKKTSQAVNAFNNMMQPLKASIDRAAKHALIAESPRFPQELREEGRRDAGEEVDKALKSLKELREELAELRKNYNLSAASDDIFDLVGELLAGTKVWIETDGDPSRLNKKTEQAAADVRTDDVGALFVKISNGARPAAAAVPSRLDWNYVGQLFNQWCAPGSALNVSYVITRVLMPLDLKAAAAAAGYRISSYIYAVVTPYTFDQLYNLIKNDFAFRKGQCKQVKKGYEEYYRPDPDQLARQLASYIYERNKVAVPGAR